VGKEGKLGLKNKKSIIEERIEIRKYLKIRNREEMKGVR